MDHPSRVLRHIDYSRIQYGSDEQVPSMKPIVLNFRTRCRDIGMQLNCVGTRVLFFFTQHSED